MGLHYDRETEELKGVGVGAGGSLMQFCCKLRGIMVLNRISPRKLWSDLDITVCNSCKTIGGTSKESNKSEPKHSWMWAEST